jgi:hypothetical protein
VADIRKLSITQNPPAEAPQFKINQRVQVVNLVDGQPGPYHGCQGIISALFKNDEGLPAARIMFSGGVEKKLLLTKLIAAERAPAPERPAPAPMTAQPSLPTWAKPSCKMVRGDLLKLNDTLYFAQTANPRVLRRWLGDNRWFGYTIANVYKRVEKFPGTIEIEPLRWYVVERQ